ncbi:PilN domain-containing protein [Dokdonella koreensis]|uniref:Type IV pilus biogenesis protein PilN n=1 Tax=Dokdonella koreensis DS-123 TaxID=1300342 RepID=A0A167GY19_9GAMM|nr:PilN domain-containing protein [Dokdonella koreensis]ANB18132.1 Type IV pilus biogenesis protein PilN [Dokdonella koreensis DS-123]
MARINLLPWRSERRKQREREFYALLGFTALAGALAVLLWFLMMGARIDNQNARNSRLQTEIKKLDEQIKEIEELDRTRSRLLTRKNAIEQLQANRSQMVHLFDEIVKTIPDGTRLTGLKQSGDMLTLEGNAESNARVASYMRNIDKSPWMGRSDLKKIENKAGTKEIVDVRLPNVFSLNVKLLKAGDQKPEGQDGAAPAEGAAPAADAAAAAQPKADLGTQLENAAGQLVEAKKAAAEPVPAAAPKAAGKEGGQ